MARTCQARQHSDQMFCNACGLVWDVNDPEPPTCKDRRKLPRAERLPAVTESIPLKMPEWVCTEMAKVYEAAKIAGKSPADAMQGAYRRFLDAL